jgi:hypothetical protein
LTILRQFLREKNNLALGVSATQTCRKAQVVAMMVAMQQAQPTKKPCTVRVSDVGRMAPSDAVGASR